MALAAPSFRIASFTRRVAALFVDALVVVVGAQLVQVAVLLLQGDPRAWLDGGGAWFAYLGASVSLPSLAYLALSEASGRRATLGKQALGLAVSDVYGARIGLGRAAWRALVKLAPLELAQAALCFPPPFWDGGPALEVRRGVFIVYGVVAVYLAATLMTRNKQSVHDLAAGTLVVRAA